MLVAVSLHQACINLVKRAIVLGGCPRIDSLLDSSDVEP